MGSSGWLKSLLTGATAIAQSATLLVAKRDTAELPGFGKPVRHRSQKAPAEVKTEFAWDADYLYFTVREPVPTRTPGASLVFGPVNAENPLILQSQMAENGVIFSDGIGQDFLEFNSGTHAVIGIAERKGVLVM
jgi:hypothetical protein